MPGVIQRASVASDESELRVGRMSSAGTVVSADGRFVVFQSREPLSPSDINAAEDVFRRDLVTGVTELVSASSGTATGGSAGSMSDDGRYVAFVSSSSALTTNDHNAGHFDVFVRDMATDTVTLASETTDGAQRRVDVFGSPVMSGDGSRVGFVTPGRLHRADRDRTPRDTWWLRLDTYVHTIATGRTRLVSVSSRGRSFTGAVALGGISHDGRLVGFIWGNSGKNRRDVPGGFYVRNMRARGSHLVWREDVNALSGVYDGSPALSGDGRYVAFASDSRRLDRDRDFAKYDVGRINRATGRLVVASVGQGGADADADSWAPSLNSTGNRMAFSSEASNLVAQDHNEVVDAFLFGFRTRATSLVSVAPDGGPGNASSGSGGAVSLSSDGRHVAFSSFAGDLVADDSNGDQDVFEWSQAGSGRRPWSNGGSSAP